MIEKHTKMITWGQWWHDFVHGRTHDEYGLLTIIAINIILELLSSSLILRLLYLVTIIMAVGVAVDLAAHLYYHVDLSN